MSGQIKNKSVCFHCGEDCLEETILFDNKQFCCSGCKTVFEILNQNNLCDYYDIEKMPGISPPKNAVKKFEYLDNEQIFEKLIDFKDDEQAMITLYLPQIHCSSCIWLLENLYKLNEYIISSRVNFLKKEIKISFKNNQLSLRKLVELLASIGYEPEINFSDISKKTHTIDRNLIFKLGTAGFCFGNIMLISLPEYFGLDSLKESTFAQFFGYINILLSLPVLFYSASDYLISGWKALTRKSINIDVPIALGILALFGRSVFEISSNSGAGYMDSLAGLIFFMLLGKIFQQKTYSILSFERDYKSYFPISTIIIESNKNEKSIPVSDVKVGDVILIKNNEIIPVDAILIEGNAHIDNSFVTGEAALVNKKIGDKIYAGGKQIGQAIQLKVVKELSHSYLTQLWNDDAFTKNQHLNFEGLTNRISKYFTLIILIIAVGCLLYWWKIDVKIAIHAFTSVLIIACPCALALSAPFTFGNVLRILGKHKFYLKNASVIEQLANITSIVFDKTGTITQATKSVVTYSGTTLSEEQTAMVFSLLRQSAHPLSKLIFATNKNAKLFSVSDFKETQGKGLEAIVNKQKIRIGSAFFITKKQAEMPKTTSVYVEINGQVYGFFKLENVYRNNLKKVIVALSKKYNLHLISGDNESEKINLANYFSASTQFLFNQQPDDKLKFIKQLQQKNQKVVMIGDGLNDAGALKQSNVGISISEDVNTFSPACDAILEASAFDKIPLFLKFCKGSMHIIVVSFIISFLYNIVGLSFAVQGLLSPVVAAILMPLSSITVVVFVTISTNLLYRKKINNSNDYV
ncbi:MAG: heavy metal translocating P-type ATPase [Bacteroidetes bacterium HGW-Bacteroidetes-12]|nr:MAG: heavy metal translocating P-type ATPase [Bacteroidetes bacterium HGW-Bacteroidetes-12]